jgi:outer membrane lipoprotein-sorting protein
VANAVSSPPSKTAQQVLALIAGSKDASYSGTVQQSSDLGLPQLPSVGPGSSTGSDSTSQILDLLTASHTARIFVGGPTQQRVQVLDTLAERDVVRNGSEVWTYDSKTNAATHLTLSESELKHPDTTGTPSETALSPSQLADKFITAIEPSTSVRVTSTGQVAGRSVYELTLTPKSGTTLVSSVTLAVDAKTGLPLKVIVDARGQKSDAFTVGFSSIDFSKPAASTFDFTPPKGASVSMQKIPGTNAPHKHGPVSPDPDATPKTAHATPGVSGTGWDSVVTIPAAATGETGTAKVSGSQSALLNELTTPVTGGRAIQTSLLSVLVRDDGSVLVGAVPIAALEAAAQ